tara:strand:- start:3246 stop:3722 length:477 start_codon:yes stop_codon:yes gene_type:complete
MNNVNILSSKDYFNNTVDQRNGMVAKRPRMDLDDYLLNLSLYKQRFSKLPSEERTKACGLYLNTLSDTTKTEYIIENNDWDDVVGLVGQYAIANHKNEFEAGQKLLDGIKQLLRNSFQDEVNELASAYNNMPMESVDVECELDRLERARDMNDRKAIG